MGRAFLSMLIAADRSQVINVASINSMWACLGATGPHTSYCTAAKYVVRGFTEALIVDLRVNAPHMTAAVVMPGHVATPIARNSLVALGHDATEVSDESVARIRAGASWRGLDLSAKTDDRVRAMVLQRVDDVERSAPTSASEAAAAILAGVRGGAWRILVGADAHAIDEAVRRDPQAAYSQAFTDALTAEGHFAGLINPG